MSIVLHFVLLNTSLLESHIVMIIYVLTFGISEMIGIT